MHSENRLKITVDAFIKGIVNEDKLPSGTLTDEYDDQTIEEWNDFVSSVEALIEKQGRITKTSRSASKDSLSTYIDFKVIKNKVEQEGTIDLRVSDYKQTSAARRARKRHAQKLDLNVRFISIIVNNRTFNSYSDALDYLQKLLETGDGLLIEGNNPHDTFWGACKEKGQNNLGKLLMRLRKSYKE